MKGKIINIPNLISFTRLIFLVPLAGYFFLTHQNWSGLIVSVIIILTDIIDGWIARKLNQVTNIGVYLDATGDTVFLAVLFFSFLYLGYIDLIVILLLAAHRFTRLALNLYIRFYSEGFYLPKHIKATGFIPMLYVFLVPFIFQYLGKEMAKIISIGVAGITYIFLLISVFIAVYRFKKGRIKIQKIEEVPVKKIVKDKKEKMLKKHEINKEKRKIKRHAKRISRRKKIKKILGKI